MSLQKRQKYCRVKKLLPSKVKPPVGVREAEARFKCPWNLALVILLIVVGPKSPFPLRL
jgi:hypothetical protein